jgi:hypothetical protein
MTNYLIHRNSLGGATSCHVRILVGCYIVMYYCCFFYIKNMLEQNTKNSTVK